MYLLELNRRGEKIYFCINGSSGAEWCNEFAGYFPEVCGEYGETSVLPPKESTQIEDFDTFFLTPCTKSIYLK